MEKKIYLVDFDGTHYAGNSFHCFILFVTKKLFICYFFQNFFIWFFGLVSISIKRKLGLVDHAEFKKFLMRRFFETIPEIIRKSILLDFCTVLNKKINSSLNLFLCAEKKNGAIVVLATAAPEEYISLFCSQSSLFDYHVSTPAYNGDCWFHNIGVEKKNSVEEFLKKEGLFSMTKVAVTDHADDLPLIEMCDRAIVFPPLSKSVKKIIPKMPDKEIVIFDAIK